MSGVFRRGRGKFRCGAAEFVGRGGLSLGIFATLFNSTTHVPKLKSLKGLLHQLYAKLIRPCSVPDAEQEHHLADDRPGRLMAYL
eukprot:6196509-Pyramimonas_sp.AAC.1